MTASREPIPRERAEERVPELLDWMRSQRARFVELVEALAHMESPSTVPETQAPVQARLTAELEALGFRVRVTPGRRTGGRLLARPASPSTEYAGGQLLLGHTDTVWPQGTLESMPVALEGDVLRGPGVFDMKGGVAQIVLALEALRELDLAPSLAPVVFINSDEEIGSPESTHTIRLLARRVRRAFVLEPALDPSGRIKTARKGTGGIRIRVVGRSSHAGLAPDEGASAIAELASVVRRLHAMSDPSRGVTVNVGMVSGGVRPNVVAPEAQAQVDVRVNTAADGQELERRIHALESTTAGCHLEIEGAVDRPPLERTPGNRTLWDAAQRLGEAMGIPLEEGRAGGASDGNTTSQFTPTLDGLGAVGDGAHATHEHLVVERTLERAALLAGLLLVPEAERGAPVGEGDEG